MKISFHSFGLTQKKQKVKAVNSQSNLLFLQPKFGWMINLAHSVAFQSHYGRNSIRTLLESKAFQRI